MKKIILLLGIFAFMSLMIFADIPANYTQQTTTIKEIFIAKKTDGAEYYLVAYGHNNVGYRFYLGPNESNWSTYKKSLIAQLFAAFHEGKSVTFVAEFNNPATKWAFNAFAYHTLNGSYNYPAESATTNY